METGKISAVVCTHNRGRQLRGTLESLIDQSLAKEEYEIVVVDNGSTDQTKDVVEELARKSAVPMRYVYEENIGLSHARNRGIRESAGEIVAFIDDDALADPDWASALLSAYEQMPDAMCIGGKVIPRWPSAQPRWWPNALLSYLGIVDFGLTVRRLYYPRYPFGVNISFPKRVFTQVGLFSEHYGRNGRFLLSHEETEFCHRIERQGGRIFYTPGAVVTHVIQPERLSRRWLLRRGYWQGVSAARFEREHRRQINQKSHALRLRDLLMVFPAWREKGGFLYLCLVVAERLGRMREFLIRKSHGVW